MQIYRSDKDENTLENLKYKELISSHFVPVQLKLFNVELACILANRSTRLPGSLFLGILTSKSSHDPIARSPFRQEHSKI